MNGLLRAITILLLAGWVFPVCAEMYKWVDEKGTVHFTDDVSNIPEKHRDEVELRKVIKGRETPREEVKEKPSPTTVSEPAETKAVEVPLLRRHELWFCEVLLNNRLRSYFIVDTGASFSLIGWQIAKELGIQVSETTPMLPIYTASHRIFTPLVTLKSIQVGGAEVENVDVLIYNLASEAPGLLGNSFLNKFRVVIDSARGKMALVSSKGVPSPDRPGGYGRDYWVGQFRFYHRNLSELKKLKAAYEAQGARTELTRVHYAIQYFENQLSELERRASLAGVPRNWRE